MSSQNPDPTHIIIHDNGSRITLKPNGFSDTIPSQDYINLQWIFDNYRKADIDLQKGKYHISQTLEAPGYQGRIRGRCETKTFLIGRGPLIGDDYVFPMLNADLTARLYPSGVPHLIWFHAIEGDVDDWKNTRVDLILQNLTITLDGVGPLIDYYGQQIRTIWLLVSITGWKTVLDSAIPQTENVSNNRFVSRNVNYLAKETPYMLNGVQYNNPNVASAFKTYGGEHWVPGPTGGLNGLIEDQHSPANYQMTIDNCKFTNFHQFGIGTEANYTSNTGIPYIFPTNPVFPHASVRIRNNHFKNVGNAAGLHDSLGFNILILGLSETLYDICDNIFDESKGGGMILLSGVAETLPDFISYFKIKNNTFNQVGSQFESNSIWLLDFLDLFYPNTGYYNLWIENNTFNSKNGYDQPFINFASGKRGTVIKNTFSGTAQSAISAGNTFIAPNFPGPFTEGRFTDNNFCKLEPLVADIILGLGSANNYVEVKCGADVVDAGTHNTIVTRCKGQSEKHQVKKYEGKPELSKHLTHHF
jgi:hypothetical protein